MTSSRTAKAPSITRPDTGAEGSGFAKVFSFLRDQLLEGAISSGDRLLPERELALRLGVSRPIVREALRAMSMMGVVEIRERVGTVVCRPDISVLSDVFAFSLAQVPDAIEDVMEARIALECQAIRLACQRASTADIERLREALDAIEATMNDADGGLADFDFHLALVRASKSDTIVQLYVAMATLLRRSHRDRRRVVNETMKSTVLDDHRRLLAAVIAGDGDAADLALRRHFHIGDELRRKKALAPAKPLAEPRPRTRKSKEETS
jgi:DNA-binding FadR family transcriptional regulator